MFDYLSNSTFLIVQESFLKLFFSNVRKVWKLKFVSGMESKVLNLFLLIKGIVEQG